MKQEQWISTFSVLVSIFTFLKTCSGLTQIWPFHKYFLVPLKKFGPVAGTGPSG
jgi:hypothetical protein